MPVDTIMTIKTKEYAALVAGARDAESIKRYLAHKRDSYGTIDHAQIEMLCTMFGVERRKADDDCEGEG